MLITVNWRAGEYVGKEKTERSKEILDQYYRDYWVVALCDLAAGRELMELADETYVVDRTNIKKYEN